METLKSPVKALRPVDLARAAGISAQQVRNHLVAGVLPPATRSASGYRVLDERHLSALTAYRALGAGYGWPVAQEVLRAVHASDVDGALAALDEAHAAVHAQRLATAATLAALETLTAEPVPRGGLRVGEVAARLGVRPSALRVWESAGLLSPPRNRDGHRVYRPVDVRDARLVATLRQARYPLPQIAPVLAEFRRSGGKDALRAALARRGEELAKRGRAMLSAAARLDAYLTLTTGP